MFVSKLFTQSPQNNIVFTAVKLVCLPPNMATNKCFCFSHFTVHDLHTHKLQANREVLQVVTDSMSLFLHILYNGTIFVPAMETKCPYPCIRYYFNMHITTYEYSVTRNAMHRFYHCVQYFQNVIKTYSKSVNEILLTSIRKVWPSYFPILLHPHVNPQ